MTKASCGFVAGEMRPNRFAQHGLFSLGSTCSLILLLMRLSSFLAQAPAQTTFEKVYDSGYSLLARQTADGGYIVVGYTYNAFDSDILLIKTDSLGDTLLTRQYDSGDTDIAYSICQVADSGYVLVGFRGSLPDFDAHLIRTNSSGDTLWTRTYGGTEREEGRFLEVTQDGGYLFGGFTGSFGAGAYDIYLVRTDSVGDTLWTSTYGGISWEAGYCAQQTLDGGFVIAGETSSFGAGDADAYMVKTDSVGDTLWTRTYGGTYDDVSRSVQQTSDGGYVLLGYTETGDERRYDVYLVRTDSLGDSLWTRTYGDSGYDYGRSISPAPEKGFLIVGSTDSGRLLTEDLWVIRIDSLGGILWTRTFGSSTSDCGYSVQQTSDGGYIICGEFGSGNNAYLIKTDENGLVARDVAVVSVDAFDDTVFTDSLYPVGATVRNLRPGFPNFNVVATIDGYTDTSWVAGLQQGVQRQVNFELWQVPPVDSCTYTLTVCARAPGDIDTTNDCMQKTIFAYNPTGLGEPHSKLKVEPSVYALHQNEPNPFHTWTEISYVLPHATHVTLEVYDMAGRLVDRLVSEIQEAGIHRVRWDRRANPSGVYFCRLKAGEFVEAKKVVVVR